MFIVMLSWQAIVRIHAVHVMKVEQVATDLCTKPIVLSHKSAYSQLGDYILHYC